MFDLIRTLVVESRAALVPAVDLALKASILLVLAWALHFVVGQKRARLRSALWNACLVGLILVPVAGLALPRLKLPVLPDSKHAGQVLQPVIQASSLPFEVAATNSDETGSSRPATHLLTPPQRFPAFEFETPQVSVIAANTPIEPRFRWRPDLVTSALVLYLTIVAILLLRLAVSLRAVGRMVRNGIAVDEPAWVEGLDRAARRVGLYRQVRLLASDGISVPIVVGWLRPSVILPESMARPASSGLVDAVLLHELAHIRRGDYGWNVIRRFVQALYWPHPLVWPLGRVIGGVREQACDDLCVHLLGGPDGYHDSLVEVAAGLVRRPEPALGLAMAHSTALASRIDWIHRTRGASDCILSRPARLTVAICMLSVAAVIGSVELARAEANPESLLQQPKAADVNGKGKTASDSKPESQTKPESQPKAEVPKSIEITVLAQDTGKPLANARISAYVDRKMESHRTDGNGKARIDLAGRTFLDVMSFDAWADGYVQQRHAWSKYEAGKMPIPEEMTVRLWPGEETLGGKVVDEQGQPVAGAKVEIWGYLGEKKDPHELAYMVDCTTDAQGQWRCRSFRKMTWAYLHLSHPDFLPDTDRNPRVHGRIDANGEPTPNEQPFQGLRDFTDVEVLKKGIRIAGRVVDEAGKPVAGAEIGWIRLERHNSLQLDVQKAVSDADGHFALPQTRPGQVVLQFKAPGRATELKVVTAKESLEPLKITLGRPYSMTGRVLDTKGNPISGCEVLVDAWRGYGGPGFFLKTDSEGRFRWDEAPAEGVLIRLGREGFESVDRYRVDPSVGEAIVTLKRELHVSGSILDAATGQKIMGSSEVEVGTKNLETGQIAWYRDSRVNGMDGQLRASLAAESVPAYRLRVRVKGYLMSESREIRSDEGTAKWDVRLTKSDESQPQRVALKGVVRSPDGNPLASAEVAVAYGYGNRRNLPGVGIVDGAIQRFANVEVVKTDAEGRFALTREADPDGQSFALVIAHPDYYAEVPRADFEADPLILARPWGRVEGVARNGTQMASGAQIRYFGDRISENGLPGISVSGNTKTDAEGKFVIDRVPPGDTRVIRISEDVSNVRRWNASTLVKVNSGETARVELGGKGRPVIARIERPAGFDPGLDYAVNSECLIVSDRPRIPFPKEVLARRDDSMTEWLKRWWDTREGFEYRRNWREIGLTSLRPDGTIRFEEVPPGDYELRLTYSGEPFRGRDILPVNVGYAKLKFTVPEIPGGYTDEPLDLGTLKPLPKPELQAGMVVPEFDVETLDGKRLKLADLRGKFVLLDFWATWCGPCVEEIPEMKAVFERYGKNDKFAMVSLSIDAEKDAPRKFVAEKGLNWHQGWLGEWAEGGVQDAYHVESIPAVFLIGPDGRLIAKGLRGREMAAAVARAIGGR